MAKNVHHFICLGKRSLKSLFHCGILKDKSIFDGKVERLYSVNICLLILILSVVKKGYKDKFIHQWIYLFMVNSINRASTMIQVLNLHSTVSLHSYITFVLKNSCNLFSQ